MNQTAYALDSELVSSDAFAQIEIRLQGKLGGRIRDFQIQLCDSGIVLRGFARTYYAKQVAQHALMAETLVPIQANEIVVI